MQGGYGGFGGGMQSPMFNGFGNYGGYNPQGGGIMGLLQNLMGGNGMGMGNGMGYGGMGMGGGMGYGNPYGHRNQFRRPDYVTPQSIPDQQMQPIPLPAAM